MGLRLFGRLAFCDHYRPLMLRLQAELDAALDPGGAGRHGRPHRAGAADEPPAGVRRGRAGRRHRRRDVPGRGVRGPDPAAADGVRRRRTWSGCWSPRRRTPALTPPQARANTYAALTELNHYARPETAFTANYDDRNGTVRDPAPPFTATVILPGPAEPPIPLTPVGAMATAGLSGRVTTPPEPVRAGRLPGQPVRVHPGPATTERGIAIRRPRVPDGRGGRADAPAGGRAGPVCRGRRLPPAGPARPGRPAARRHPPAGPARRRPGDRPDVRSGDARLAAGGGGGPDRPVRGRGGVRPLGDPELRPGAGTASPAGRRSKSPGCGWTRTG